VIGVNLVGAEQVWLDRRTFEAGPGSITLYNPGQIQGGGAAEGAPWHFVSLYAGADRLATDLGLAHLEFDRALCFAPELAAQLAQAAKGALSADPLVCGLSEDALVLLLGEVVRLSGVRLPSSASAGSGMVAQAQELLAAQLHQGVALDTLGRRVGPVEIPRPAHLSERNRPEPPAVGHAVAYPPSKRPAAQRPERR
jgi:AraC family transcriptional regulator, chemosensory pili system protein ChpD